MLTYVYEMGEKIAMIAQLVILQEIVPLMVGDEMTYKPRALLF